VLEITSLSSALFLFLVGFCLVLSFEKNQKSKAAWIWRKWRRGIWLIFLSYLLFFFKFNLEKLEAIANTGILQLIGLSLIIGSLFFLAQRKIRFFLILFSNYFLLLIDLALRTKEIQIPFLNVYFFPFLPNFSYVLSGILIAEGFFAWREKNMREKYLRNLFFGSLIFIVVLIGVANFDPFLIFRLRFLSGSTWQPLIILVIFNTLLIVASLSSLALGESKLAKIRLIRRTGLFGQEALNIYFFHILLGWGVSRYLLKGTLFGLWASLAAVIAFLLLGWGWIKLRKAKENY
jgi:hypothetical protein